jgi:hypothetical protein
MLKPRSTELLQQNKGVWQTEKNFVSMSCNILGQNKKNTISFLLERYY